MEISTTKTWVIETKGNECKRIRMGQNSFEYLIIWDTVFQCME
jgi:hypothetical protein